MEKISRWIVFVVACLTFTTLLIGCEAASNTNNLGEVSMKNYYIIEDFESITIGESTYQDVYNIASPESMQITSYGGICEYPMKTGGYIVIKFYGKDLVVGVVEEVPASKRFDE